MADRDHGEYRPMYERLLDGADFAELGADARSCLYPLKLMLKAVGIRAVPGLVAVISDHTAFKDLARTEAALQELEERGWIRRERNVVWLVRGLEFEPTLNPANELHRKHVKRSVDALPSLAIVADFKAHFAVWFAVPGAPPSSGETPAPQGHDKGPEKASRKGIDKASEGPSRPPRSTTPTPTPSTNPPRSDASHPASRAADAAARVDDAPPVEEPTSRTTPLGRIAGAVRETWWGPDGKPPSGWAMGRELSIWRPLLEAGTTLDECLEVIQGARYLQLAGGIQRGPDFEEIAWLHRDEKLTGRLFNNTHSGAVPLWTLALEAFHRGPPSAPAKKPAGRGARDAGPTKLGALVSVPGR